MHLLTTESFRSLLTAHPAPCVSIYMPTPNGPRSAEHHRLRWEAQLAHARNDLHALYSPRDIEPVLAPLTHLAGTELWHADRKGLAAFACPRFTAHFHLTEEPEELVIVASSFHVRPLLAQMQSNRHYFLLAFDHERAALFRGTRLGLVPVELHGLPLRVEAERKDRETMSTRHPGGAGYGTSIRHGSAGGDGGRHEELERYLREVDRAISRELAFEKVPLILAAPRELIAAYRTVSRYAHVAEEALHGSHDWTAVAGLHEKAWPIVRRELEAREAHLLDDFGSLAAHGRASSDVAEIARCAVQGRVRELFLADGEHLWGRFDRDTGSVQFAPAGALVKGDDLLDDVAEAVLARGGEVLALERERMPSHSQAAALLRW